MMKEKEILEFLGLKEEDIERYRYASDQGDYFVIKTRTGGDNREHYFNKKLTSHTLYSHNYDDNFDRTYAHYFFKKLVENDKGEKS